MKPFGGPSASVLSMPALALTAVVSATPADATTERCRYHIEVSAQGLRATVVPGSHLRTRGVLRREEIYANRTARAKTAAAFAAQRCLRATLSFRGVPPACRPGARHSLSANQTGFVEFWRIENLPRLGLRVVCIKALRVNRSNIRDIRFFAVRRDGGTFCNLGVGQARRPRRFLFYRVPSWNCGGRPVPSAPPNLPSSRPVPQDPGSPAVRNCRNNFAPVCAHVGNGRYGTFRNACYARRAGRRIVYQGRCRAQARPARPNCPRNYRPVCASTRRGLFTFSNACQARAYGGRIVYFGTCRRQ